MEVILKQDIPTLGYKDDVVKVKDGYARNFLIPKGLAILATESSRKVVAEVKRQKAFKDEKIRKEAEIMAEALKKVKLTIGAKAGTSGKIFGSVNNVQIADALKEKNYDIDRKRILVDGESIKEIGSYKAKINLHKEISVEIEFEVIAE
ncbi:MAG: 50S ribosomal protein L9 [Bacteroidetes bacterium]|nr:50S ribosomal protein L9 [Bacteroidota bacterium]